MKKKDNLMVILGVVAILAIVGLVFAFKMAMTGEVIRPGAKIYAIAGEDIYGQGTPMNRPTCDELYGNGWWFTQNPQQWTERCKDPGEWLIVHQRAPTGPEAWGYESRKYIEIKGRCCPPLSGSYANGKYPPATDYP